jgi:hypothetical protein
MSNSNKNKNRNANSGKSKNSDKADKPAKKRITHTYTDPRLNGRQVSTPGYTVD